ncbi:MAG: hypothetical protein KBC17_01355 [Candidatus Pacebacteria bacterium]|nr:hypothetical protein [Candidatus Paceibacterota bacterium]
MTKKWEDALKMTKSDVIDSLTQAIADKKSVLKKVIAILVESEMLQKVRVGLAMDETKEKGLNAVIDNLLLYPFKSQKGGTFESEDELIEKLKVVLKTANEPEVAMTLVNNTIGYCVITEDSNKTVFSFGEGNPTLTLRKTPLWKMMSV